jgi:hypothetical protein
MVSHRPLHPCDVTVRSSELLACALQIALQLQDAHDASQVDALGLRQLLDEPQPLDVCFRVQPRVSSRALRGR